MQMDAKYKAVRQSRCMTRVITAQAIVVQHPSGVHIYANQTTLDYKGLKTEDVIAPLFRERIFFPTTSKDYAK